MRATGVLTAPHGALAALALRLLLAGCASAPKPGPGSAVEPRPSPCRTRDGAGANLPADLANLPDAEPRIEPIRTGGPNKPYQVLGRDYVPSTRDVPFSERGLASWYGRKFHGRRTANGEIYDMYAMTAAHPTLPIPSYARIRNPGQRPRGAGARQRPRARSTPAASSTSAMRRRSSSTCCAASRRSSWSASRSTRSAPAPGAAAAMPRRRRRGQRRRQRAAAPAPTAATAGQRRCPCTCRARRRPGGGAAGRVGRSARRDAPLPSLGVDRTRRPAGPGGRAARLLGPARRLPRARRRRELPAPRRRRGRVARAAARDLRRRDRSTACRPAPIRAATKPQGARGAGARRARRWCRSSSSAAEGRASQRCGAPQRPPVTSRIEPVV